MNPYVKKKLVKNSRKLRKEMTKEERHLWYDFLKTLPATVHRQKVIGSFIVDFYIASAKLVIELDGSQHFSGEVKDSDVVRDAYFASRKIKVLRYSNLDINRRFDKVCEDILNNISPHPSDGK